MDPSSRCCFGGCPTRGGAITASIFLICIAVIDLICSWIAWTQNGSAYGTSVMTLSTIIFASLAIWGFQAKKWWPCVCMIVVLVLNIIGCIIFIVVAGIALAANMRHCPEIPPVCDQQRVAEFVVLVVYVIALLLCAWFIYIYAKAIDFIKSKQRVGLPVHVGGVTNVAYVVGQPYTQQPYPSK